MSEGSQIDGDRAVGELLIVGIGASAGGLAAFKSFLQHMPADSGMAFVLVQHLAPQHKSILSDLLAPCTRMQVVEADDGMAVASNCVYVIPPDATLTIEQGILRVTKPAPVRQYRKPIDQFFCSLAEDQGERAIAIVLSGVGSDGSLGVRTIKEHGGLTFAQSEFDHEAMSGMPHSAAATGLVDHVVPIEAMPEKLLAYQRFLADACKGAERLRQGTRDYWLQMAALLRKATGHDFSKYKETTFGRRVQRRMQVRQLDSVAAYLDFLSAEPSELNLLFSELLIGVTEFFRNPEAFEALSQEAIPKILSSTAPGGQIRVWVPGCASGEEVYSIAMLFREAQGGHPDNKILIFGTDLDPSAIAVARAGRYSKHPSGLAPERFARWFVEDGGQFCPIKEIRDLCLFSVHSVIKDPPFSRLDLISCRNLLIYLNNEAQNHVLNSFHFALKPNGFLFLGPSESTTRAAELFEVLDKKSRILQRRNDKVRRPVVSTRDRGAPPSTQLPPSRRSADASDKRARQVLERFSPVYFIVDARDEVERFSGPETGHYLEPSAGHASLSFFRILRESLRPAVRAALHEARSQQRKAGRENLSVKIDGRSRPLTLIVEPIGGSLDTGTCVVAFRDESPAIPEGATGSVGSSETDVEHELRMTKAQLQNAVSDLELHVEEMKSTTEEYQSVNEELQSSNEELETAKEEMQSVNEELQTLNAELYSKNDVLGRVNSDLQNLMDSTEIAIVFLDDELRIKSFTPAIGDIFPLREGDRGRPLNQIVSRLIDMDLMDDFAKVQRTLATVEREMQIKRNGTTKSLLMRARPYRTVDSRIDGVVVTFLDIDAMTQANEERARYAALARASGDAIIGMSLKGVVTSWSPGAEALLGYPSGEMIGNTISIVVPPVSVDEQNSILERVSKGEDVSPFDTVRLHKQGHMVPVSLRAAPVFSSKKVPVGISSTLRDISGRKKSERLERLLNRELSHRVKNSLAVIQSIAKHTLRSTPEPEKFAAAFQGRLQALATAHEMLTEANWSGAEFSALATQQLAPFLSDDPTRLRFEGPPVLLDPELATSLGLVLHELATNASKYGALSVPGGGVMLSWRVAEEEGQPSMRMTWREVGGPVITAPARHGFGSRLIQSSGISVQQNFETTGLVCELKLALYKVRREEEHK